ncbi:hypothetical protein KAK07_21290 [Ideonella sp. 4Y16]|uniref:hypothetical protein n=1 Tax=Ideonella alba TaxID=2824118 RepID=UPI001B365DC8|nr:hypothetical protein [Ideonella alba]MBQ0945890.1 hypothetical protein [Ideonella alba]
MTRPSLLQHFDAPEGHVGAFGWLCGYSADAPFMVDATDRFTLTTRHQRAASGRVVLALVLDPGQPRLAWGDVPGVVHLPVYAADALPFNLLHAKVALLGFRCEDAEPGWRLRLIVSTGNWTTQTVEESLDMAWCVEVDHAELQEPDDDARLRCADIAAAADLLIWLRRYFDQRLLVASVRQSDGPTLALIAGLDDGAAACARVGSGVKPRFLDSRALSLLDQLPDWVAHHAGAKRRSHLVMGSGFYEGHANPDALPSVPAGIVTTLRRNSLLTKTSRVELVVNESGCQAIAASREAIASEGWGLLPPSRAEHLFGADHKRTLHAKFIISWNPSPSNPNLCTSGWLYLGSGNLTNPGFCKAAISKAGNLEAGVVLATGDLALMPDRRDPERSSIAHLLPFEPGSALSDAAVLAAGAEMPERPPAWVAPLVAFLQWQPGPAAPRLFTTDPVPAGIELLDPQGQPCSSEAGAWIWPDPVCPPQACLRCPGQPETWIPVIDEFGRIAPVPLPAMDVQDITSALGAYPAAPEDASPDDDEHLDGPLSARPGAPETAASGAGQYATRQMMQLIDTIARRQVLIPAADWRAWCLRLEQLMILAKDSDTVQRFKRLPFHPLQPLTDDSFRPEHALAGSTGAAQAYLEALHRIAQAWGLPPLHSGGRP